MGLCKNMKLHQQTDNESIVLYWSKQRDSVPINPASLGNIMYKGLSIDQIPKSQYPNDGKQ